MENMTVRIEVWALAADHAGVWLLDDDAWRPDLPIPADSEAHAEVELELARRGVDLSDVVLIHSTSWRTDRTSTVLTYLAVVDCDPAVEGWPDAKPVTLEMAQAVGPAPTHSPVGAPAPRYSDVLLHGLRHLRYLLDHDATTSHVMAQLPQWREHLSVLEPAFAEMYGQAHQGRAA
jgi:hypothetical protein